MNYTIKYLKLPEDLRYQVIQDIKNQNNAITEKEVLYHQKYGRVPPIGQTRYTTTWNLHKHNVTTNYVANFIMKQLIPSSEEWEIVRCWGTIAAKSQGKERHYHGTYNKIKGEYRCDKNFVCYLECCENCASLIIEDSIDGDLANVEIKPSMDQVVMLDKGVWHKVEKQTCDHNRIILATNIKQKI
tara:strand:+ start:90 stop:647 length:558 start_codon:yes stop_codon:yes gene_type:complete